MAYLKEIRTSPHIVGESLSRGLLTLVVVSLLLLASGGFVIGMDVGFSFWWIILAVGIAIVAGFISAGLVPTIGSLWLISLWWFVFPPLVGYLTGNWAEVSRYSYPRMLAYAYTSAFAELRGGIESGVQFGLLFAIVFGLIGYAIGMAINRVSTRVNAS